MTIKKGDFVEFDYTGRVEDIIFDTTIEKIGKELNSKKEFKPLKICVGQNHVLPGLDSALVGLKTGKHKVSLKAQDAFGKKDPKLLKLMPMKLFKKQGINPYPGLELNMDGRVASVKSVSGGRVIVDFNHPLSGKDVDYEVDIKRIIEDKKEQLESLLELMSIPFTKVDVKEKKADAKVAMEIPEQFADMIKKQVKDLIGLELSFKVEETKKEKDTQSQKK